MMSKTCEIPGIRIVVDDPLEGEPEFPGSPSNSPSFLHSPRGKGGGPDEGGHANDIAEVTALRAGSIVGRFGCRRPPATD